MQPLYYTVLQNDGHESGYPELTASTSKDSLYIFNYTCYHTNIYNKTYSRIDSGLLSASPSFSSDASQSFSSHELFTIPLVNVEKIAC